MYIVTSIFRENYEDNGIEISTNSRIIQRTVECFFAILTYNKLKQINIRRALWRNMEMLLLSIGKV